MRPPFDDWNMYEDIARGDTEPAISVHVVEDTSDDEPTLRMMRAALRLVPDDDSDHDIAVCVAPESVGRSRSEIPVALPVIQVSIPGEDDD